MAIFDKMGFVWPLIIDKRLEHRTPHMFPCHRSHSWISGGDHFLVKNPQVLAFGIIENGRSFDFRQKWALCSHWPSNRGSYTWPHICFLAIGHILGFFPLLASGLSKRKGLVVWVQWLQSGSPIAEAFFGGMTKVSACRRWSKRIHQRWAPMLGTCSQVLWVKNKATQEMLNINALRPSRHYFP
jgi:hypothetical protein